jgi:hypothetical protein
MRLRNIGAWSARSRSWRWRKKLQIPSSKIRRSSKIQTPILPLLARMKPIRPLTIIGLGPILLVVAFPAGMWLVLPSAMHLAGFGWACLIGAWGGLVCLGPMAAVVWIRTRFPEWFARNYYRLNWYTSIAGAMASGFWLACTIYHMTGKLLLAGIGILILGASIKIGLSDAVGTKPSQRPAQESAED